MDSKLHAIIMQIHEECLVKICDQNIALDERVIKFATNRKEEKDKIESTISQKVIAFNNGTNLDDKVEDWTQKMGAVKLRGEKFDKLLDKQYGNLEEYLQNLQKEMEETVETLTAKYDEILGTINSFLKDKDRLEFRSTFETDMQYFDDVINSGRDNNYSNHHNEVESKKENWLNAYPCKETATSSSNNNNETSNHYNILKRSNNGQNTHSIFNASCSGGQSEEEEFGNPSRDIVNMDKKVSALNHKEHQNDDGSNDGWLSRGEKRSQNATRNHRGRNKNNSKHNDNSNSNNIGNYLGSRSPTNSASNSDVEILPSVPNKGGFSKNLSPSAPFRSVDPSKIYGTKNTLIQPIMMMDGASSSAGKKSSSRKKGSMDDFIVPDDQIDEEVESDDVNDGDYEDSKGGGSRHSSSARRKSKKSSSNTSSEEKKSKRPRKSKRRDHDSDYREEEEGDLTSAKDHQYWEDGSHLLVDPTEYKNRNNSSSSSSNAAGRNRNRSGNAQSSSDIRPSTDDRDYNWGVDGSSTGGEGSKSTAGFQSEVPKYFKNAEATEIVDLTS